MSQSVSPAVNSLSRAERVQPTAHVRHFDQLSETAQEYVAAWVRDGTAPGVVPTDLEPGEVIVFTEYVQVNETA